MSAESPSLEDEQFNPFRRHDRYGTGGAIGQPLAEKLRLTVLTLTVLPVKIAGTLTCLLSFYVFCRLSPLIPLQYRADAIAAVGKIACRACLFSIGFLRVAWKRVEGTEDKKPRPEACVIVSNHCSWIDILVHMSRFFPAFVARHSTKHLMFIGLISKKMGCLYVDREKNGQGMASIVKERVQQAARGEVPSQRPMLLFPEGTTTNGQYLLPFKKGAFLAGCPVQPVVLKYGQGTVSPAWESISALKHIWLVLCIPFHSVTVTELPVYVPDEEEKKDPQLFAENVYKYMLAAGGLRSSKSNLTQKRAFHSLLRAQHSREKAE